MAGRPAREASSPSAIAPALLRYVHARGIDPALLLDADRNAPELHVTPMALATMIDRACELLGEPHLGLRLPTELPFERYDALTLAARAVSSPRRVLDIVVQYAPLLFPGLSAAVESDEHALRIACTFPGHPRGLGIAVDELLLSTLLGLVTRGTAVAPSRVWLASPRPPAIAPLYAALGTRDIELGARNTGFELSAEHADLTLPGADARMLATATALADAALANVPRRGAFGDLVATKIEAALGNGATPSADAIASALHMSTRTLQRRLDEEGTRFSDVADVVRERRARELLRDPRLALGEVAFRTGFSDLATFSRAFKRWSGLPPGAFRRRHS